MAKPKKKQDIFPVVFTNHAELLQWVKEEASKETRSISNFIVTKLKVIKDKENETT